MTIRRGEPGLAMRLSLLFALTGSLVTGALVGCGHYAPPTRVPADSRLESISSRPARVEAGPTSDEECEEEDAAKKRP